MDVHSWVAFDRVVGVEAPDLDLLEAPDFNLWKRVTLVRGAEP